MEKSVLNRIFCFLREQGLVERNQSSAGIGWQGVNAICAQ